MRVARAPSPANQSRPGLALKAAEEASSNLREGTTFSRAVKSFSACIGTAESRALPSRQRCRRQTSGSSALEGLRKDNLRETSQGRMGVLDGDPKHGTSYTRRR